MSLAFNPAFTYFGTSINGTSSADDMIAGWYLTGTILVGGVLTPAYTRFGDLFGQDGNDILSVANAAPPGLATTAASFSAALFGEGGDDLLTGFIGHDSLAGGLGNDTLLGGDGQDSLAGENGQDSLDGGAGQDTLDGGDGIDTLLGGAGDDLLHARFDITNDVIDGGEGLDRLRVTSLTLHNTNLISSVEVIQVDAGPHFGTAAADYLDFRFFQILAADGVSPGALTVDAGQGNDYLLTGLGDNTLQGGEGDDAVAGGEGHDQVAGGNGNDLLWGNDGQDTLDGGDGNDTLLGGAGDDLLIVSFDILADSIDGGEGTDRLRIASITLNSTAAFAGIEVIQVMAGQQFGTAGADILDFRPFQLLAADGVGQGALAINLGDGNDLGYGNAGDDTLAGGLGDDVLDGGLGSNLLLGENGSDALYGGAGADTIDGGEGIDTMVGGAGNDVYFADNSDDVVVETANGGFDILYLAFNAQVLANFEQFGLFADGAQLIGGAGDDRLAANSVLSSTLIGGDGQDTLWDGAGNDTLFGGNGHDIFYAQSGGADGLHGGFGDDQFVVADTAQLVVEAAGEGYDTLWVTISGYTVPENVEVTRLVASNAVLNGGADDNVMTTAGTATRLNGLGGNDELWSGPGADTLDGGAGDDVLRGQGGADVFIGGAGNDQFVVFSADATILELADGGYDVAWIVASGFTLPGEIEVGRLLEEANSLTGSAMGENLVANPGLGSLLLGMGGNDILWGSGLADTFDGGTEDDIIYAYGGADRFLYREAGWGFDQVSGFDREQGMKFDLSGLGLSFEAIQPGILYGNGNGQFSIGADRVLVYGVTAFQESDFIF